MEQYNQAGSRIYADPALSTNNNTSGAAAPPLQAQQHGHHRVHHYQQTQQPIGGTAVPATQPTQQTSYGTSNTTISPVKDNLAVQGRSFNDNVQSTMEGLKAQTRQIFSDIGQGYRDAQAQSKATGTQPASTVRR